MKLVAKLAAALDHLRPADATFTEVTNGLRLVTEQLRDLGQRDREAVPEAEEPKPRDDLDGLRLVS